MSPSSKDEPPRDMFEMIYLELILKRKRVHRQPSKSGSLIIDMSVFQFEKE